jgi:4'-phosphopantetheinyl transferase
MRTTMLAEQFMPLVPPTPSSLMSGDVHVWCADVNAPWPASILYGVLSEEERVRARSFAFEEDRRRYVHAHGFLRLLLGRYLDQTPGSIKLTPGRNGKPCLPRNERTVEFNLSHAHALVLCALACDRQVGVDVEWRDRELSWRDVVSYACSEREQAVLASLAGPAQADTFFSWWTLKEAYVKALGVGLELPLGRIDVADEFEERFPASARGGLRDHRWALFTIPMGSDYSGALVTEGTPSRVHCFQWAWGSDEARPFGSPNVGEMEEQHARRPSQ